ncbi:acyl-CoA N-acyltransferase [Decorospora gaudefroyi]|uniref:Acyl-CoA N-acyltransferase n=1 Tax=Decorospora gaudefroyi TaxID=184978 RepID=A0A6A5KKZ3_9PLEO|nr:acyl-CoA N-acyltransferase [Decorospora gaudefroyi]
MAPSQRIPPSDISISEAVVDDLPGIVDGLYKSFPPEFWERKEPLARRPKSDAIRHERMVKRITPSFLHPRCRWIAAKYIPTGEIIACSAWCAPGNPVHNVFRKSAVDFYGWADAFDPSEDFEEMWAHVDDEQWDGHFAHSDAVRSEVLGDEPHWYLATLFTRPEWQGRGVGALLLNWGIEQADAYDPPTPLYLEASVAGRPVYLRSGFVPVGDHNMIRRGPAKVKLEEERN